jgi:hypothetical protein
VGAGEGRWQAAEMLDAERLGQSEVVLGETDLLGGFAARYLVLSRWTC